MTKLSEKEFLTALRLGAGLYSRTVKVIKKEFGVDITRQSVKERAEKYPEILQDIADESLDVAEEGVQAVMRSKNENVKLKACLEYLSYKGKQRGYIKTTENIVTESDNNVDLSKLTDEELKVYYQLSQKAQK